MPKKVDKFAVFSKKFAGLDDEGQNRLVKAAFELLKAHKRIKNMNAALCDEIRECAVQSNFSPKTERPC
ncbi:MAG: hypothetical protein LBG79_02825 [Spirochaetaceae bacterium]|jgi:5-methylcytosine-specific restriction endonuclease McrBC regulatory subunit McrC|nr:hypothetical protein [Spirochaetaceae bacterium]